MKRDICYWVLSVRDRLLLGICEWGDLLTGTINEGISVGYL